MKKILGLDLGTNSIGWALIEQNTEAFNGKIIGAGVRIIPMDQSQLGDFEKGNTVPQTAERTKYRSIRRLRERFLLRRERLHRVLNILGFLPIHYANSIDFISKKGQFIKNSEVKLAYVKDESGNFEFLFENSFRELTKEFKIANPNINNIPFDWTLYYLRNKALTQKIEKEELAWIILNFNQKRGYNQLRGEEDEKSESKTSEFFSLKVIDVIELNEKSSKNQFLFKIVLENGWEFIKPSNIPVEWKGKIKEFIITTDTNEDGSIKLDRYGKEKRSFRAPAEDDWTLLKKKTESDLNKSLKTVGSFIYDNLLKIPNQKIKGKLIRTIERDYYHTELEMILTKQNEFHPELSEKILFATCCQELYPNNELHKNNIANRNMNYLLLDDIIFYQRPLKSKKYQISNCRFETRSYKDNDGNLKIKPLKAISKSHPRFQEFRLWQFIHNLGIYQREVIKDGKLQIDVNITDSLITTDSEIASLFEWLNNRKEIDQKGLLKYFKLKEGTHRWNYVEDKSYPCNKTRADIVNKLLKVPNAGIEFLTPEIEESLWHILYSVTDKKEIVKALATFAKKYNLDAEFIVQFKSFKPFDNEYGSYSSKAINKLLPLMRVGKYWNEKAIPHDIILRIDAISERLKAIDYDSTKISNITDDDIPKPVLKSFINCKNPLSGLNTYQANYAVYNRHAEEGEILKWAKAADIDTYLKETFKQHSLRNPIVEQIITETLRVVKDIWNFYGEGKENYFDEIHIELGRDLKNPASVREQISKQNIKNENTNLRIRSLLTELATHSDVDNVRPFSPSQQEILKIFEDGILNAESDIPEDIISISKSSSPSKTQLIRYKLWLDQKYRSPYTGQIIPLSKLFTPMYEVEHIIPQSRYFDDSLSNKVICESEVNKDKGNNLGYEYIKEFHGKIIELGFGKKVKLFDLNEYENYVKQNFIKNPGKMKKLLMEDIPEGFIERQMNDTRYISKLVKNLLSNIVREENEKETTSKNVIALSGGVTNALKQDWGLNNVWNDLITPRFERLNTLTNSNDFGEWTNKDGKRVFQTKVPLNLQKGFTKKRIDHRHHALDAIIIATASRNHVNYLNNQFANAENKRIDLRNILCIKKFNTDNKSNYRWIFKKPWESFTADSKEKLESFIVSFKQNNRVINKTTNYYQRWKLDPTTKTLKKIKVIQTKGENWAIRKPLHKETVYGKITLRLKKTVQLSQALEKLEMIVDRSLKKKVSELKKDGFDAKKIINYFKEYNYRWNNLDISKVEIYYYEGDLVANRVNINDTFDSSMIKCVTDNGIRNIMQNHLDNYSDSKDDKIIEHPELAFSPDGIDALNKNIVNLNNGKFHKPIYKVRTYETKGNKFNLGNDGNKRTKFVEAAKGTNLFFAIYQDKNKKRIYETIPLNVVIERQKMGLEPVPEKKIHEKTQEEAKLLFYLSPNDLVIIPSINENFEELNFNTINFNNTSCIYKMLSSSGNQCFFIQNNISSIIWDKNEFSALNKMEKSIDGIMIKEFCYKVECDRIGNIKTAYK